MSGADIAAEIAGALAEAGEAVGNGPLVCTIRRTIGGGGGTPWSTGGAGVTDYHEVVAVSEEYRMRDTDGTLMGRTIRTLTVDATGIEPLKSDMIVVGVGRWQVAPDDDWLHIQEVRRIAPGGVALAYELDVER